MTNMYEGTGFHDQAAANIARGVSFGHSDTRFHYTFENHFYPFAGEIIAQLNQAGLPGLFDPQWLASRKQDFFNSYYNVLQSNLVQVDSFPKEIDVSMHGAYSGYNWELFFYIPLAIAVQLSKNQKFQEAQRFFHLIFNPTSSDPSAAPPERFWRFLAFRQPDGSRRVEDIVRILSTPRSQLSLTDQQTQDDILNGYDAILNSPFQPFAVARLRPYAFQYYVVMKYLDNLIAWGDSLFQQYTVETINEATQLYVLAANILGERPQKIPPRGSVQGKTFAQLRQAGLGPIGEALVSLEGQFPFNLTISTANNTGDGMSDTSPLFGMGRALFFCIPPNETMLGYWDTVADRLFKIRHCMDLQGIVRPLALFDPPLDPGLLVKAQAMGIDIGSILSGLNQPVGPLRSLPLIQKVLELCGEVRGMGSALLAALEKGDAEHLALVRQRQEVQIQQLTQDVRFLQWKQAEEATEALLRSRASALLRYRFYQNLLGIQPDTNSVPDTLPISRGALTEDNFDDAYGALVDQYANPVPELGFPPIARAPGLVSDLVAVALPTGNLHLNLYEFLDLNVLGPAGVVMRSLASAIHTTSGALAEVPDFSLNEMFWGIGPTQALPGGRKLKETSDSAASSLSDLATITEIAAGYTSKAAGYQHRAEEWVLQMDSAARELMQIGRQILSSLIAEQVAHHDYEIVQRQIANAQEVDQYLHEKFTNEDLYLWMQGEISRMYYEYYRLAFDTAGKAERTMKQELMRPELDAQTFVRADNWDSGRMGLLSGERLHQAVKRMEMAYHDYNRRELELTRHVSLRQLDPLALLALRATGSCQVSIPEWLYDLDGPGHYMRRIKMVAVSIPCVAGPYTSVNCTLTLRKSSLRVSPDTGDDYLRQGEDDPRFLDFSGSVQSIVTSSGQADSGMFEANLHDERFLPFEGAGAISAWQLDLPKDYPSFDYNTISDVILDIRYTARPGVEPGKVRAALGELFQQAAASNLALLFSLRYDFPTDWAAFQNSAGDFSASILKDYFPYFTRGRNIKIEGLDLYSEDLHNHQVAGDPSAWSADSDGLNSPQASFIVSMPPGPVLVRGIDGQVFLIIRYTLGG